MCALLGALAEAKLQLVQIEVHVFRTNFRLMCGVELLEIISGRLLIIFHRSMREILIMHSSDPPRPGRHSDSGSEEGAAFSQILRNGNKLLHTLHNLTSLVFGISIPCTSRTARNFLRIAWQSRKGIRAQIMAR